MPVRRVLAVIAWTSLAISASAAAQSADPGEIEIAKGHIASGDQEAARRLLEGRLAARPGDVEALFLLGLLAIGRGDNKEAIRFFRRALVVEPDATRIRLELARAFYLDRDFENAFRQFQFARAGNPPGPVVATIDRYLMAIRQEKGWSYTLNVAIAPDSNINNATSAREAILFGLPFELSETARRRSGIGLAVEAGAEVAPRIGKAARLRLGGSIKRHEYQGSAFDDTVLALHAGPRLILDRWDLSLVGTAFRRWFGPHRYNEGAGARIEATHYPSARSAVSFGLAVQDVRYPYSPLQDGPIAAAWGSVIRTLTPSSSVTARLALIRQDARAGEYASWSHVAGAGYYRDLAGGYSIYVEPSLIVSDHDAVDPLFGTRRRDRSQELRLAVLNRRILLSRFTPRLSYTFVRRRSNISLYQFTQSRLELGITSSF